MHIISLYIVAPKQHFERLYLDIAGCVSCKVGIYQRRKHIIFNIRIRYFVATFVFKKRRKEREKSTNLCNI